MGYHVVDPDSLPTTADYPCDRRSITDAVGLANLAVAVYELAPGEQLPRTYHYHEIGRASCRERVYCEV